MGCFRRARAGHSLHRGALLLCRGYEVIRVYAERAAAGMAHLEPLGDGTPEKLIAYSVGGGALDRAKEAVHAIRDMLNGPMSSAAPEPARPRPGDISAVQESLHVMLVSFRSFSRGNPGLVSSLPILREHVPSIAGERA